jgi:hypothetical protein
MQQSSAATRRWSLARAALYGLILMGVVFGVELLGIWTGSKDPDPWFDVAASSPAEFAVYWIGFFLTGPIVFVVIALIRNLFVRDST